MAAFLELATLAEELAGEAGRLKKRALIEIALGRVAASVGRRCGQVLPVSGGAAVCGG